MFAGSTISVPLEHIRENVPLPFDLWDGSGQLLIAKGQIISREQIDSLRQRRAVASKDDVIAWRRSVEREVSEVIRNNRELATLENFSGNAVSDRVLSSLTLIRNSPMKVQIPIRDPITTWNSIHMRASTLLHEAENARMFLPRLEAICEAISIMVRRMPDQSLYLLIHQSSTSVDDYSTHHALLTTAVSCLVADQLELGKEDVDLIMRSALTMNIAMTELQDKLALQSDPLNPHQREIILSHPIEGSRILRACGVEDKRWLNVVEDHHETKDGRGYPGGKRDFEIGVASKVVHQADLFAARLSPRKGRAALAANLAARKAYLGADGQPDNIGASLVKKLGIYPPGSFVQLASGETAVVVRRGLMANKPRAAAIVNSLGQPYTKPQLRETSDKVHEIRGALPADSIKTTISHERILPLGQ